MPRKILVIGFAAALSAGAAAVTAETEPQAAQLSIEQVKDNLYNIIGSGGNVAALVTSEGVILVDDKFEQNLRGNRRKRPQRHRSTHTIRDQHALPRRPQRRQFQISARRRSPVHSERANQHSGRTAVQRASRSDARPDHLYRTGVDLSRRSGSPCTALRAQPHQQRCRHILPRTRDCSHGRHDGGRDAADRLQRRWQHRRVDRNRGRDDGRVRLRHRDPRGMVG